MPTNSLERVLGSLRQAFAAVSGKAPDGTVLKSVDERMTLVDESLEEFGEALAEPDPVIKEEPVVPKPTEHVTQILTSVSDPAEILKSLPEPVQALFKKAQDDATAAATRATEAEAKVAKAEEEKTQTLRIAKAEAMLAGKLAGDKTKLADVLKALTPEQTIVLEEIFKGAVAQIVIDPTVEIGKSGKPATNSAAQATTRAAEIRKHHPDLSESQALSKVYEQDPELYEASLAGAKGE